MRRAVSPQRLSFLLIVVVVIITTVIIIIYHHLHHHLCPWLQLRNETSWRRGFHTQRVCCIACGSFVNTACRDYVQVLHDPLLTYLQLTMVTTRSEDIS